MIGVARGHRRVPAHNARMVHGPTPPEAPDPVRRCTARQRLATRPAPDRPCMAKPPPSRRRQRILRCLAVQHAPRVAAPALPIRAQAVRQATIQATRQPHRPPPPDMTRQLAAHHDRALPLHHAAFRPCAPHVMPAAVYKYPTAKPRRTPIRNATRKKRRFHPLSPLAFSGGSG